MAAIVRLNQLFAASSTRLIPSRLIRPAIQLKSTGYLITDARRLISSHTKASVLSSTNIDYRAHRDVNHNFQQYRRLGSPQGGAAAGQRHDRSLLTKAHIKQTDTDASPMHKCVMNDEKKSLEISWLRDEDSPVDTQTFAYPWLRDNCRCDSCYSQASQSRLVSFMDLDVEACPRDTSISTDGSTLVVGWPDGHISKYSSTFLKANRFDASENDPVLYPSVRYWGKEIGESLRVLELDDLLSSDEVLCDMLLELKSSGMCCVKGGGGDEGQVKKIADRIGFLHVTYFGATDHVKTSNNNTHLAYTSTNFPMHTDLAYKGRPPGVLMFSCIQQAHDEGGENWFTDGFKVALDLKKVDPDAYDILCRVPMEFKDIGTYHSKRIYSRSCHPVIGLDRRGHPDHIYVSDHGREPMLRVPAEDVLSVYRALKRFSDLYHHHDNVYNYKLKDGDIMIFDNRRVLHGRASFKVTQMSSRHLETGYIEWDEINSRIRILSEDLSAKKK